MDPQMHCIVAAQVHHRTLLQLNNKKAKGRKRRHAHTRTPPVVQIKACSLCTRAGRSPSLRDDRKGGCTIPFELPTHTTSMNVRRSCMTSNGPPDSAVGCMVLPSSKSASATVLTIASVSSVFSSLPSCLSALPQGLPEGCVPQAHGRGGASNVGSPETSPGFSGCGCWCGGRPPGARSSAGLCAKRQSLPARHLPEGHQRHGSVL
mmetsp:Transcript_120873/g.353158  ORF Transcript_120873/g.353158 Transcript_120873/m.353158 type:complete len:206 (-) Transcript_120873:1706-2323(-)